MPVKIDFTTEDYLRKAALPVHGNTYAVIPHGTIIDNTKAALAKAGFAIEQELYKSTFQGSVAQGVYHLNGGSDPEMKMMFAWSNSYNKTMRFKCSAGSYVFVCMNGMLSGNLGNASRKHTGSALQDAIGFIEYQASQVTKQYNLLVEDKQMLKNKLITRKKSSEIIGRLFADEEILTLTQLGVVQREMKKSSFDYNADPDSAWYLYNHVTNALKDSHPSQYLDDHAKVHNFFVNEFGQLVNPSIQPLADLRQEEQLELSLEEATSTVLFL